MVSKKAEQLCKTSSSETKLDNVKLRGEITVHGYVNEANDNTNRLQAHVFLKGLITRWLG